MKIVHVPMLMDNYAYLLVDETNSEAAIVDPADADAALNAAKEHGVELKAILNTHHHWDHTGGNQGLVKALPDIRVIGYAPDADRIPGITEAVNEGDEIQVSGESARVLSVPCHTKGHVAYLFGRALFCGDTLFAAGCGRFFEGTADQMYTALYDVFGGLPNDTLVYCGHEYTAKNLEFAKSLEPKNDAIDKKIEAVNKLRAEGKPSVPTTLGEEKTYNPFMRVQSPELIATVCTKVPNVSADDPIAVLGAVRQLKDNF